MIHGVKDVAQDAVGKIHEVKDAEQDAEARFFERCFTRCGSRSLQLVVSA